MRNSNNRTSTSNRPPPRLILPSSPTRSSIILGRKRSLQKNPGARESESTPATRRILPKIPVSRGGRKTKEPPRYRPPPRMLREIRQLQNTYQNLIPHGPFAKLVREITVNIIGTTELRYQSQALKALHEAAEAYLVGLFEDSYALTLHRKRATLLVNDMRLAYRIRGDSTSAWIR